MPPHPATTPAICPHTLPHALTPYQRSTLLPHVPIPVIGLTPNHIPPPLPHAPTPCHHPCHMPPHPATCPHTLQHVPTPTTCPRHAVGLTPYHIHPPLPHAPTPCHMPPIISENGSPHSGGHLGISAEIRGSISQPLEPIQPKSLYIHDQWASAIQMHPNLSTLDKYWAS